MLIRPRMTPKHRLYIAVLLILFLLPLSVRAIETLKATVEKSAQVHEDTLEGQVVDRQTQQPVADANVSLPDMGFQMRTNASGYYHIPRYYGKQPIIMSVQKAGYAPFSVTISETSPPLFQIRLQKSATSLVLDNQLRHLGDGSYSPFSSNATAFRKPSDGPAIRIPFNMQGMALSADPTLRIGSIVGLDTPMVHFLTQNDIGTEASPLLIKLNGKTIAQIQVNGDNQNIHLPLQNLVKGQNILAIEAGYHYPDPGRIDYDDMELMHLVIYP